MISFVRSATATVGVDYYLDAQVSTQVSTQVKLSVDKLSALLEFCSSPRSRKEMQDFCNIKTSEYFRKCIIRPMLAQNLIQQTIPDKPNSKNQKYIKV